MSNTTGHLKSLADRINRLLDERDAIKADVADIYQEAKSAGYVPKILRKVIARARMDADKRREEDELLEMYEAAMDGPTRMAVELARAGKTAREIEEATGIDHSVVAQDIALHGKPGRPRKLSEAQTNSETARMEAEPGGGAGTADIAGSPAPAVAEPDGDPGPMPPFLRRRGAEL